MRSIQFFSVLLALGLLATVLPEPRAALPDPADKVAEPENTRTGRGLVVLYDFQLESGPLVKDRSGVVPPLDLRIANPEVVRRTGGALEIRGSTTIRTEKPPVRLLNAIRQSGAITIEAWIRPARTDQEGPARIVSFSNSPNQRNFTLGQEFDTFDFRLRTTSTSTNGIPSISTEKASLTTNLTHVVYTRQRAGRARIYINGTQAVEKTIAGNMSNWDKSFQLLLGNELSGNRPWLGTYRLVAIYSRELQPQEVVQNYQAGAGAETMLAGRGDSPGARLFDEQVARLLSNHCLECHDSASHKGGLDISRKTAALAGGESGKAILPGKAADSLLWQHVESDEMPKDRPPLSTGQKKLLRAWIDAGATWTTSTIDPVLFTHQGPAETSWIRRLTLPEYIETVRSTVGVDIASEARELLPPDLRVDGFTNTAYNLHVDLKHVEAYGKLAETVVSRMDVKAFAARFSKSRLLTDDSMRDLIARMGKWILRGPLEEQEVVSYRGISTTVASAGGNFEEAVGFIITAMMQSPRFIYRVESQQGDGTDWPAGEYELASRLSYILWGGPPDEALLKDADAGRLSNPAVARAHVERMLKDPRAIERSLQFADEWFNLQRLEYLKPNRRHFPDWDPQLAIDMRSETLAFFKHIAWTENRPLAELFNAQVTFATPALARHYGLKPTGDGLARYDLAGTPSRGGILTQGSILTVGGDEASMVTRGLFVLHDMLRGVVKDPPPCVDTRPVPTRKGLTQRSIAELRIADKSCGGCHSKFEPLAFGLEKYDGLGAFHDQDKHGNKLREDGTILVPGGAKPIGYKTSAELMDLLAGSPRMQQTITWKLTQFALGRPLGQRDAAVLENIHATAQENGGTYASLITAIVMSDLVQMTRTERSE